MAGTKDIVLRLFLFVCLFNVWNVNAEFNADKVAEVLEKVMSCYDNPGMAASVVKNGKVIFSRGFGVTNLETKQPVNENTVFGIASVSKSFAASLLVKLLYETTNLTVDSRVRDLLGEEFLMNDEFRTKEATFADLMGHRMAVPANNRIRFDTNLTRNTLLERLPLLESRDQFRVKYTYSNLMYGLVTVLAERLGEESWEDLVHKHLLQPLGMSRTVFATTADLHSLQNLATGYTKDRDDFVTVDPEFSRRWGNLAGSGAVMSTANDMTRWMTFHLQEGQGPDGNRVMESKHVRELHKPRLSISLTKSLELRKPQFPISTTQNIYAHGLRKGFYREYERLAHSGSTLGYKALMSMLPGPQIGVFTALTGIDDNYTFRSAMHYYLLDAALDGTDGVTPWLNETTMCSFPEPWRKRPKSSSPLKLDPDRRLPVDKAEFEGIYHNKAFGYLHINYNETLQALTLSYGWGQWRLYYRPLSGSDGYRFYGKAMGISALNLNPLYFLYDKVDGEKRVFGLTATAFESRLPPKFTKLGSRQERNVSTLVTPDQGPKNSSPVGPRAGLSVALALQVVVFTVTSRLWI